MLASTDLGRVSRQRSTFTRTNVRFARRCRCRDAQAGLISLKIRADFAKKAIRSGVSSARSVLWCENGRVCVGDINRDDVKSKMEDFVRGRWRWISFVRYGAAGPSVHLGADHALSLRRRRPAETESGEPVSVAQPHPAACSDLMLGGPCLLPLRPWTGGRVHAT